MSDTVKSPRWSAALAELTVTARSSAEAPLVQVVDDDPAVGRAMARLFASAGLRCEVYASADDLLRAPRHDVPTCLVVDLRIADVNGIELYERLCSSGREVPAVFITGFGDIRTGVRAMKAGAVDFLQKPVDADALLAAVARALERDSAAAPARAEQAQLDRHLATLTPGEREVLRLLVAGLPNKQIAAALGTKERTVKTRRGSVLKKMHADSLADVVRMGLALGLGGGDGQRTQTSK